MTPLAYTHIPCWWSSGLVVWRASYCDVYCGVTLRRLLRHLATASVWRRGREATGAELLFLRGCEGEAANMQASTGAGKDSHSGRIEWMTYTYPFPPSLAQLHSPLTTTITEFSRGLRAS